MLHERMDKLIDTGGIIHIRGDSGTGKTILASRIATEVSRGGRVDWLCTDGKTTFTQTLKNNIIHYGGLIQNILILQPRGYMEVRATIEPLRESVKNNTTKLVVIDPVTRVLNMGRRDEEMWGRVLIEETLPNLAGLALDTSVCFIITSEVRMLDEGNIPIHHEKIRKWTDLELVLERPKMTRRTTVYIHDEGTEALHIGDMTVSQEGVVEFIPSLKGGEGTDCSESTCSA